ncbi:MAG: MarR family transcriptional regulator [Desulfobacterales bacterium]|nr:MarR family transcriptional regulator [Desulfobacterales bacterium]
MKQLNYTVPTDCPYYLITRASLSITSMLKKEFMNKGVEEVKPAYLSVLMCLWNQGTKEEINENAEMGIKLTELGRCAGLEPSTMTGIIDRMERDELLYRSDDPNDRRAQKIKLTEKGIQARTTVTDVVNKILNEVFAGIKPDQIDVCKTVLNQVLVNLNKWGV